MLINSDVKSLEVYTAADYYGDDVLKNELLSGLDLHSENQERFSLPDRLTAKRFVFKLLYGATDYGYAHDPDFFGVGYSQSKWARIIDEFYGKYKGIAAGHKRDVQFVKEHRYLEIPSGRFFEFYPIKKGKEDQWPLTKIKNYPINCSGFTQ